MQAAGLKSAIFSTEQRQSSLKKSSCSSCSPSLTMDHAKFDSSIGLHLDAAAAPPERSDWVKDCSRALSRTCVLAQDHIKSARSWRLSGRRSSCTACLATPAIAVLPEEARAKDHVSWTRSCHAHVARSAMNFKPKTPAAPWN